MKTQPLTEYNLIYIFSRDAIKDLLKIGKTSVKAYSINDISPEMMKNAFLERYKSAGTMAVTDIKCLHIEPAVCISAKDGTTFNFSDDDVREVILNSHFENVQITTQFGVAEEWYRIDLEQAIAAIQAVKDSKSFIDNPDLLKFERPNINFREEQNKAIVDTCLHFKLGNKMLWNAKMRFGKTLCALEVVRRQQYKKTLILTHRPTVRSGWYEDFHNLSFEGYLYGSKNGKEGNQCNAWVEVVDGKRKNRYDVEGKDFETLYKGNTPYIYFASMQDLRGSKYIFGSEEKNHKGKQRGFDKNDEVFENDWDLIILDEAHEGTQTDLGKRVISKLTEDKSPRLLYLSGTPYNILNQFEDTEIFTWDYVMEQNAKAKWNPKDGTNPYEGLAQMHIYTYDLHEVYEQNKELFTDEDFFSFSEFFRVWEDSEKKDGGKMPEGSKGKFVHEQDVRHFLDLLCDNTVDSYYPFSTDALRRILRHTFWLLPGVKQVKALEEMINQHPLHQTYGYHVINVAGDGKSIAEVESAEDTGIGENSALTKAEKAEKADLDKVKKGISQHDKTITLSCGRLTTGVSVPEWTGVFVLAGGYKTGAAAYMQTIFRCQTPYKNGDIKRDCYAFDFAPDRTLTVVDEYIKMQPAARSKQFNNNPLPGQQIDRGETTATLDAVMRHMPVIAMKGGQEVEYNATNFVTDVNRAYTEYFREHGLHGRKLTRDFATFTPKDYQLLEEIGKLFGGGKVTFNNDGTLVVTEGGLTGEKAKGKKITVSGKKKVKSSTNTSSTTPKQTDESEQRRRSQNILDQIYVRLPLLIFGAVEDANSVTIDQLLSEDVIDQESWCEFMPAQFTKEVFRQIAHLIKVDALIAYAADIIKDVKDADNLPIEERILVIAQIIARFHFPDKETVLTPWRVVNMHMCNTVGGYNFFNDDYTQILSKPRLISQGATPEIIENPDTHILEINSKSGVYPLWLAYSIWRYRCDNEHITDGGKQKQLWADILNHNIFVLCKTPMAVKITRRALAGYDKSLVTHCKYQKDLLETLKDEKKQTKFINELKKYSYWGITNMDTKKFEFKAVVGNPPYQLKVAQKDTSNGQKRVSNIFHLFQILAENVGIYTSLIYPGVRWIHRSGRGLEQFGFQQINDPHLKRLFFYPNANDFFDKVSLPDGITIVEKDTTKQVSGFEYIYIENGVYQSMQMNNPGHELMPLNPKDGHIVYSINKVVAERKFAYLDKSVLSQKLFAIESDFVETHPTLVRPYSKGTVFNPQNEIKLLTNDKAGKAGRAKWYIANRNIITTGLEYLDKWKVVASSANAGGQKRSNQLEILDNYSAFGRVKVALKTFSSRDEATNFYKYVDSELIRFAFLMTEESLTSLAKQVPDIENYKNDNGIINFSGDVNAQLYQLFEISSSEQEHIKEVLKKRGHKK